MGRLAVAVRRPVVALPVDRVRRRLAVHALPPDVAVIGERDTLVKIVLALIDSIALGLVA
jgi:hypothetical protein